MRGEGYFAANNKSAIAASGGYQLDKSYATYVRSLPPTNIERLLNSYLTILPDTYLPAFAKLEQQKDALKPGDIASIMNIQQQATSFQQQWIMKIYGAYLSLFSAAVLLSATACANDEPEPVYANVVMEGKPYGGGYI